MNVAKTPMGHQVLKDKTVALTPRQRSALILFDGKRSLEEVMGATAGSGVTWDDVDLLFELKLITDGGQD